MKRNPNAEPPRKAVAKYFHCHEILQAPGAGFDIDDQRQWVGILHREASAHGVEILTYCVLSDGCQVLLCVPPPQDPPTRPGDVAGGRPGDLVAFLDDVKRRFSEWAASRRPSAEAPSWNRVRMERFDPRWAALAARAVYVDLAPVRAGLTTDPVSYPWTGFAAACAAEGPRRDAYLKVAQSIGLQPWMDPFATYRKWLVDLRPMMGIPGSDPGFPKDRFDQD